jgi:hypothetical protein
MTRRRHEIPLREIPVGSIGLGFHEKRVRCQRCARDTTSYRVERYAFIGYPSKLEYVVDSRCMDCALNEARFQESMDLRRLARADQNSVRRILR